MRRRIAVVGDTLTSGGQILDYTQTSGFCFHGHKAALIGESAYCQKCKSMGTIAKAGGPYRIKYHTTREAALDDDIVLCRCPTPPRIIAGLAGESWVEDREEGYERRMNLSTTRAASTDSAPNRYGQQFTLQDANGHVLCDTYYTVRLPSGSLVHGVTDHMGRTRRYATDGAQRLRVYLGHREA
ncbi:hypothetical protein P3T23_000278 [Paraburkholderia sp. GAS448]|uniref:PAAR domain-containing protein n=1 Tax=Paraburkholderia sp. GAS448 TaxID=3035136 RepID=UPI003D1C6714